MILQELKQVHGICDQLQFSIIFDNTVNHPNCLNEERKRGYFSNLYLDSQ